jgi:tetratricopeptide (TPR) repeat protein
MSVAELPLETASGVDAGNPYPGLQAFAEGDRAYFHGRTRECEELFRLVRREVLTVLFGRSGLGKTSLLNAGLFPLLRQADLLPVPIRLDFNAGQRDLVGQVRELCAAALRAQEVEARAQAAGETLWEYFHRTQFWSRRNRLLTPLLVFDQFEEIFTLGRRDARVEPLLEELADLIENHIPAVVHERLAGTHEELDFSFERPKVRVVVSLREDFLPQLEGLVPRIPSLARNRYRLLQMDGHQALEAILGPAGGLVGEEVAREILRVVAGASREESGGETAGADAGGGDAAGAGGADPADSADLGDSGAPGVPGDPGGVDAGTARRASEDLAEMEVEPALLSLFCRELNERRRASGLPAITRGLVQGTHGEILTSFYAQCLADIGRPVRTFIEERLLTGSGYRQSVPMEEALARRGVTAADLAKLVDRRLLRLEDRLGRPHVELIHDVMTRVIRESRDRRRTREAYRRLLARGALAASVLVAVLLALAAFSLRESRLKAEAEKQRARAQEQRERTARFRGEAEQMVSYILFDLRDKLANKGNLDIVREITGKVLAYLSNVQRSVASERLRRAALTTLGGLDTMEGKSADAERNYREALLIARALHDKDPADRLGRHDLAVSFAALADLLRILGNDDGARENLSQALPLLRDLALHPSGKDDSQVAYEEALAQLSALVWRAHNLSTATRAQSAVVGGLEELAAKNPANQALVASLAVAYRWQGDMWCQRGDGQAARGFLSKALVLQERLAHESPGNRRFKFQIAISRLVVAQADLSVGDLDEALDMAESAAGLARPYLSQPGPFWADLMATAGIAAGDVLLARGDTGAALARYRQSLAQLAKNAALLQDQESAWDDLATAHARIGSAHARRGERALAREEWQKAVDVLSPWIAKESSETLDAYVRPLIELGRLDEARPACRTLHERDWNYQGVQQLCRAKGLLFAPGSTAPAAN